ncbi:MAG TPA: hypothetical protein VGI95_07010 [Caulobacteraceae bacterium]
MGRSDERSGLAKWLARDWVIADEVHARRMSRVWPGVAAWLAMNVVTGVFLHQISMIGAPLVLLALLRDRGPSPRWPVMTVAALPAALCLIRWTNGAGEWTSGIAEFNLVLALFAAQCARAQLALPRLRTQQTEIVETFA